MHINIDTSEPLSDQDKQILGVLAGNTAAPATTQAKPPAAKKAATPAPAAKEPEPEPEPEDLVGDDTPAPTVDDATAKARALMSSGKAAVLKEALGKIGVKKVTEIPEDRLAEFMGLLDV